MFFRKNLLDESEEGRFSQDAVSGRVEPWPHVSGVNHYTMGEGFGEV